MYVRGEFEQRETPYATLSLIALNALVFVIELSLPNDLRAVWIRAGGVVPADFYKAVANFSAAPLTLWFTPLTAQFLHVGWWHFLVNMLALLAVGPRLEETFGRWGTAFFYLASGAVVFVVHIFISGASITPALGSTGAVGATLGAYLLWHWGTRVFIPFGRADASLPLIVLIAAWLIAQWLAGLAAVIPLALGAQMAWWIPLIGLGAGIAWARVYQMMLIRMRARQTRPTITYYNPYDNPDEEYRPPQSRTRSPFDTEDEDES